MNASFSILQKLKNQFLQTVTNKNDFHFAFAPFAFSVTNEDFFFLKNNATTGAEARKYIKELSEFSILANSVSKKPNFWAIDSNQLLFDLYENTLNQAKLIDPSSFTPDEEVKLNKAKKELYKTNGTDSAKLVKYKFYETKLSEIEFKIIEHDSKKSAIDVNDNLAIQNWELTKNQLVKQKTDLLIEWNVKGYKTTIENAKKVIEQIMIAKTDFIQKWQDAKNIKLNTNNLTDEYGFDFKVTTCLPNSLCDYQSNIWKKISVEKNEIIALASEFESTVPQEIIKEFGNIEILLDKIEFEYCFVDIIRPWFDEEILKSQNWKYDNNSELLSDGSENLKGNIPCFPAKIVLIKNIDLKFSPNEVVNEVLKDKLIKGEKLFFGSMMLKNIPINLDKQNITSYKIHSISNTELKILNNNPNLNNAKINKMELIQNLQKKDQVILKNDLSNQKSKMLLTTSMTEVKLNPIKPNIAAKPMTTINPAILHSAILVRPLIVAQPTTPAQPTNFKIEGTISDDTNAKIGGVEIQIIDNKASIQSVLTNENGFYSVENIPSGSYTIKTKKAEYINVEKTIQLNANSVVDLSLTRKPIPVETFQVLGIIAKKMPFLPNPRTDLNYI